jgi:Uma2 family endonuclease
MGVMAVPTEHHRFSLEDYHRLAEAGVLREDDRVELIRGELIEMNPIGSRHAESLRELAAALASALGDRARIAVQDPMVLEDSEPQPDLMVLRRRPGGYWLAHPGPADVLLVVEVADSSASYDRGVKLPLYAAAGVPEAWLVDLALGRLELHRSPTSNGYRDVTLAVPGDRLAPGAFPDALVEVATLLP